MGQWIFGCDICQEVCPWNRKAEPAPEPAYKSRAGLDSPALLDLIQLDREAFNALFRRNPVKRPKRRGFLRNVAVALGNSGMQGRGASPDQRARRRRAASARPRGLGTGVNSEAMRRKRRSNGAWE